MGAEYSCIQTAAHMAGNCVRGSEGGKMCPQLQFALLGSLQRFGAGTDTSWPDGKLLTWLRGQRWCWEGTRGSLEKVCLLGFVPFVPVLKYIFSLS